MIDSADTYLGLPNVFYDINRPRVPRDPKLISYNHDLAKELGLNLTESEVLMLFSGTKIPDNLKPFSMNYCGHQFGHFNPQLGDGRAHVLAELKAKDGILYDIQLKGSGTSRFSRRGDGLSPLGPVIREFLVSEAMHALKIPTTRALAAISTGDTVFRDEELPGGIFTRISKSHIRVGTFEYYISRGDIENLRLLADYSIKRFYPEIEKKKDKYQSFFKQVATNKIKLVSQWLGVGFIHGVMNTDNTNIAGITIDFGPCAFMDEYKPNKVFSSIDRDGRYAYNNQMNIALWNMSIFARTLFPLIKEEMSMTDKEVIKFFEDEFETLEKRAKELTLSQFARKFGFETLPIEFESFYDKFMLELEKNRLDFTQSFYNLRKRVFPTAKLEDSWKKLLSSLNQTDKQTQRLLDQQNPTIIPRNHLVEKAIALAQKGNTYFFLELWQALKDPFQNTLEDTTFFNAPKAEERVYQTFCGT